MIPLVIMFILSAIFIVGIIVFGEQQKKAVISKPEEFNETMWWIKLIVPVIIGIGLIACIIGFTLYQ